MNKVFEELGKGSITLGNIVCALVFLKAYLENAASLLLLSGVVVLLVTYVIGARLVWMSTR